MAYGNANSLSSAYLEPYSTTLDSWMSDTAVDLFSTHNPFWAQLWDVAQEPGGDFQFMKAEGSGEAMRFPVWGRTTTGAGAAGDIIPVTRAAQATTTVTPSIMANTTNALFPYAGYTGSLFYHYRGTITNRGKEQVINDGQTFQNQIRAGFYDEVGTDMLDTADAAQDKIMSAYHFVANTAYDSTATRLTGFSDSPGGIDPSDAANTWWRSYGNNVAETINSTVIREVKNKCRHDTGVQTGIRKSEPDFMLMHTDIYSTFEGYLEQSQRAVVTDMLKGGCKYLEYAGMRVFFTGRIASGAFLCLNSSTFAIRYGTLHPVSTTPGWTPVSLYPAMMEKGYNWVVGAGGFAPRYNGCGLNKAA